jgi:hypothetical protein
MQMHVLLPGHEHCDRCLALVGRACACACHTARHYNTHAQTGSMGTINRLHSHTGCGSVMLARVFPAAQDASDYTCMCSAVQWEDSNTTAPVQPALQPLIKEAQTRLHPVCCSVSRWHLCTKHLHLHYSQASTLATRPATPTGGSQPHHPAHRRERHACLLHRHQYVPPGKHTAAQHLHQKILINQSTP